MHYKIDRYFLAFAALFFSLIAFAVLVAFGGHYTRAAVALSALCGAASQYLAQSDRDPVVHGVASGLGFVSCLWAVIIFSLGY